MQARVAPQHHKGAHPDRGIHISQDIDIAVQAEKLKKLYKGPHLRIKNKGKHQADGNLVDDDRQKINRLDNTVGKKAFGNHRRQKERDGNNAQNADQHNDDDVFQGGQGNNISKEFVIIFPSHEYVRRGRNSVPGKEGRVGHIQKRVRDHQSVNQYRWQD